MQPDNDVTPTEPIAVLVLRNQVLFPDGGDTYHISRERSLALVDTLPESNARIAVFTQRQPGLDAPGPDDLFPVGTLAKVTKSWLHSPGNHGLTLEGLHRVQVEEFTQTEPFLVGRISRVDETGQDETEDARNEILGAVRERARTIVPALSGDAGNARLATGDDVGLLADHVADALNASVEEKAGLLAISDVRERARATIPLMDRQDGWQRAIAGLDVPSTENLQQLWPLTPEAPARIAAMLEDGSLTADEADRLREYDEKGFTVWEGLIEPEQIDELLADIRDIKNHPGRFLTTGHRRSIPFRFSSTDFDTFENVFDLHVPLESSRRVCLHPTILRFLEIMFEAKPVAMQQLLFQRSNIHPLHQDTAFVCIKEPLQLTATWIALEDVVPGRGELTYYEGSHKIPHHEFHGGSKFFNPEHDSEEDLRRAVQERAEALGCEKRDLIAKKGDVFIWAADLVHGSNARTRPEEETRMSCVTHYCPETTQPLWTWLNPEHCGREKYGERALLQSAHYILPRSEEHPRPVFRLGLPS